jgi:hypothetical protein
MKRRTLPPAESDVVGKLADALQEALQLLDGADYSNTTPVLEGTEQATLLQQCLALCEVQQSRTVEPLRTLHHFACTGGSLISKCVAAMPNVQLLSELDPLSTMQVVSGAKPRFAPTDMTTQLRQSTRGTNQELLIQLFRAELRLIHADAAAHGLRLVLRDHTHSQYCYGPQVAPRPSFLEVLPSELPVRSVLTVRHPLASFASLVNIKWLQFQPPTIDEYSRRYLAFLDHHPALPRFKYEDFVANPAHGMQTLCALLELPFNEAFEDLFSVFQISGDSGRTSARIGEREPRAEAAALQDTANESPMYRELVSRLDYGTLVPGARAASAPA